MNIEVLKDENEEVTGFKFDSHVDALKFYNIFCK